MGNGQTKTAPAQPPPSPMPEVRLKLKNANVKRGEDITFYCEANTKVSASWMKGEKVLENGGKISISEREKKFFTLKISDAREEDGGQYTVNLSNSRGMASDSATVKLLEFNKDWRKNDWIKNEEMKCMLGAFQPSNPEVKRLRFLLHGPVGAGKSSIINSIKSTFQGRLTVNALAATASDKSFTTTYMTYEIQDQQRRVLPFVFNDIMGLEDDTEEGVLTADIISALQGHVCDGYKFNARSPLSDGDHCYKRNPTLNDKVHCLVSVIPAHVIILLNDTDGSITKMKEVRKAASDLGIPQVVFLTHVDLACPAVKDDLKQMYSSKKIKEQMTHCSNKLGVPMNCIFPVKNYHEETDMDDQIDYFILSALKNIVNFADDYVYSQKRTEWWSTIKYWNPISQLY